MGKTIIQQARGHGSKTYQVRPNAYRFRIEYPKLNVVGKAKITKLINSAAHSCPLARIVIGTETFFVPAANGIYEGQEIEIGSDKVITGNIVALKNVPFDARVFNIEIRPGDGGKMVRTSGNSASVIRRDGKTATVLMSSKKEVTLDGNCRATVGIIAGEGRLLKPVVKAGKKHYMMKARNKLWPRTSAIKFNAVDHPFGGGRGKRIKSKIAKRNAPAGAKVGHIRPSRTGVRK
jgi:large subunit ribosomal protein L2